MNDLADSRARHRDILGRVVREAWVKWALTQPNPKASWLLSYDQIAESDKEADRQIGEAVARAIDARVEELEDALGTNRMCANCTGGIHHGCAGILRCNCGCSFSRTYTLGSAAVVPFHRFNAQGDCIIHRACGVVARKRSGEPSGNYGLG